jgi:hypothetical protein
MLHVCFCACARGQCCPQQPKKTRMPDKTVTDQHWNPAISLDATYSIMTVPPQPVTHSYCRLLQSTLLQKKKRPGSSCARPCGRCGCAIECCSEGMVFCTMHLHLTERGISNMQYLTCQSDIRHKESVSPPQISRALIFHVRSQTWMYAITSPSLEQT